MEMKLKIDKKDPRPNPFSIRVSDRTLKKIKELAKKLGCSQADLIEKLVELAE